MPVVKEGSNSGAFKLVKNQAEEIKNVQMLNHKAQSCVSDEAISQKQVKESSLIPKLEKSVSASSSNQSSGAGEEEKGVMQSDGETVSANKISKIKEVNSMKVGELNNIQSEPDHVSADGKDKPKKYSLRLDVVKKTIFRCLKKFYYTVWKNHCQRNIKDSQEVFEEAQKFTAKIFSGEESSEMILFLVALIDNKKRYTHENSRYVELRTQISSMLSCFNKNKIDALLKLPEFSKLVLYFLNQPIDEIFKDRSDPEVVKVYSAQINELKLQCEGSLTSSS